MRDMWGKKSENLQGGGYGCLKKNRSFYSNRVVMYDYEARRVVVPPIFFKMPNLEADEAARISCYRLGLHEASSNREKW